MLIRPVFLAFLVAPLAPAVLAGFLLQPQNPSGTFLPAGLVTYTHALLLGLPLYLVLRRVRRLTRISVTVAAALIGALPITLWLVTIGGFEIMQVPSYVKMDPEGAGWSLTSAMLELSVIGGCAGLGASAGLAWVLIARPNRLGTPASEADSKG